MTPTGECVYGVIERRPGVSWHGERREGAAGGTAGGCQIETVDGNDGIRNGIVDTRGGRWTFGSAAAAVALPARAGSAHSKLWHCPTWQAMD